MRTGWLLSLQGNFSGAAEAYDRASRLESQCVNSRLGFLNMQIALGDAKQTLQAAQKLLQPNPSDLAAGVGIAAVESRPVKISAQLE